MILSDTPVQDQCDTQSQNTHSKSDKPDWYMWYTPFCLVSFHLSDVCFNVFHQIFQSDHNYKANSCFQLALIM